MKSFYKQYGVSPEGLVLCLDQSDPRSYGDLANWKDLSPYANHGVQNTAGKQPVIGGVAGLSGMARTFDGATDLMQIANFATSRTALSVFCWNKGVSQIMCPLICQYDYGVNKRMWTLGSSALAPNDKFEVVLSSDGGGTNIKKYRTTTVYYNNLWHFLGFTWNSGVLKLYADEIEAEIVKLDDVVFTEIFDSDINLSIGSLLSDGSGGIYWFAGSLPQCYIWNRVVRPGEVQTAFNAQRGRYGI